MKRVVVWIHVPIYRDGVLAVIRHTPGVELVVIDGPHQLAEALEGAEGMISAGASNYTEEVARIIRTHGTGLKWFQTVAAGHDGMETYGPPPGAVVTGQGGNSAPIVAEHAMALLLALARNMRHVFENQAAHGWDRAVARGMNTLYGKTAAVVGFGAIGQAIAKRAKAFDMQVLAVSRSGRAHPLADESHPIEALNDVVGRADALLLAAPLKPSTRGMIDADVLAACKPGALLVNVGRGGLVDQAALRAALESGRLGGAGLDVTSPEPLPADDPLWAAPNLILSPHCAGAGSPDTLANLGRKVRENLEHFIAGRPLNYVVDFGS